jgi:DnaJ family protein C protein 8
MNFDQLLRKEATSYEQDMEIERILKDQYSQDPFYILGMNTDYFITCQVSEKEIKSLFRLKSRLVHPDKCKHPYAEQCFGILKKAEQSCLNPARQQLVFSYIETARREVFFNHKIEIPPPVSVFSDNPQTLDLDAIKEQHPDIGREIQLQFKKNVIDLNRRAKIRQKNEFERDINESDRQERQEKKRKDFNQQWEESRPDRIQSWKSFEEKRNKKKKTKEKPLGALPF